jgi:hypothetical protein
MTSDDLERIERLRGHVGIKALHALLKENKEGYYDNLARRLEKVAEPVDQRSLDYKRGFFRGAEWILSQIETSQRKVPSE